MVVTTGSKNIEARKKKKRAEIAGKRRAPTKKPAANMSKGFAAKHAEAQKQLKSGKIASDAQVSKAAKGAKVAQPEKKKSFWQKTGDKIRGTGVGKWLEDKGVLASGEEQATAETGMLEAQAEFKEKSLGEKAKFHIESATMAAGATLAVSNVGNIRHLKRIKPIKTVQTTVNGVKGYAINTATKTKTTSYITKLAGAVKNPKFVASTLVGAIGSYPFAGFIKEEALQTLSFAVKSAFDAGDVAGAEESLAMQEDLLNPDIWDKLIASVPMLNVVKNLKEFYEAAKIKTGIDRKILEDMKVSEELGETPTESARRNREEKKINEAAIVDDFNEDAKIRQEEKIEIDKIANAEEREAAAAFWLENEKKKNKLFEKERQASADFWLAYQKEKLKLREDNSPSQLDFGLL